MYLPIQLIRRFFSRTRLGGLVFAAAFAAAIAAALTPTLATAQNNYSDIWWNPNESGWGLTLADHGTRLAGVWYTFDSIRNPVWFVMPAAPFDASKRFVSADIYQSSGPPYFETYYPSHVVYTKIGTANFDFAPPGFAAGTALFSYVMPGGIAQTKQIQRASYGTSAPFFGSDYTDVWWSPHEPGWGLSVIQHGDSVAQAWFTYGSNGQPIWFMMPGAGFASAKAVRNDMYFATGPAFDSVPFDPTAVQLSLVGSSVVAFTDKSMGTFHTNVLGFAQARQIDRLPFGAPLPTPSKLTLTVSKTGSGFGTIASNPIVLNCGTVCTATVPYRSTFTLTAIPNLGSRFAGWSGNCSDASLNPVMVTSIQVNLELNSHCIATFN